MLLSFSVKNYLSFKEKVSLSFIASNKITELKQNYTTIENYRVLNSLVIFGNNASGKSNILKAINFSKEFIINSANNIPNTEIEGVSPFKLDSNYFDLPSTFEYTFIINYKIYKYTFSLTKRYITEEILSTIDSYNKKEEILFFRQRQDINLNNFDDMGVSRNVIENTLALSKFAKENSSEAGTIHNFFINLFVFENLNLSDGDSRFYLNSGKKDEFKKFLLDLLGESNSGIEDIHNFKKEEGSFTTKGTEEVVTVHNINNLKGEKIVFNMFEESYGTQKIYKLAGSLFAVMEDGKILFIDELDASLSTKMMRHIIHCFNKHRSNSNAQLVFTSNNTSLLDIKYLFRRDQIYFTKKFDKSNSTDVYTLHDSKIYNELDGKYSDIRKDLIGLEKLYLANKIRKAPIDNNVIL